MKNKSRKYERVQAIILVGAVEYLILIDFVYSCLQ